MKTLTPEEQQRYLVLAAISLNVADKALLMVKGDVVMFPHLKDEFKFTSKKVRKCLRDYNTAIGGDMIDQYEELSATAYDVLVEFFNSKEPSKVLALITAFNKGEVIIEENEQSK